MKSEAINNSVKTSINNNGIFRILLNNPKNHNVLSEEMMNDLQLRFMDERDKNNGKN